MATTSLKVAFDESDAELVRAQAKEMRLTTSAYIRMKVLEALRRERWGR